MKPPRKNGGGRPHGSRNRNTFIDKVMQKNALALVGIVMEDIAKLTPIEVMLHAMAIEAQAGRWINAAGIAAQAAPYVHPRLAQMQLTVKNDLEQKSEDEILAEIADLERQVSSSQTEPQGSWTPEEDEGVTIDAENDAPPEQKAA